MKKKIVTALFAAAFVFGFLFPCSQPQNPHENVLTCSVFDAVYSNF